MHMNLSGPCSDCPFRTDRYFHLSRERAQDIADALGPGDATFQCHKTLNSQPGEHCAGALIILMRAGLPNQWMRITGRLGTFDADRLNMDAPVYDTLADFVSSRADTMTPKPQADTVPPADAVLESLPDNGRILWRGGNCRVMEYQTAAGPRYAVEQGNATGGFVRVGDVHDNKALAIDAACGPL